MLRRLVGLSLVTLGVAMMVLFALIWFFVPMTNNKPPYFAVVGFGVSIAVALVGRLLALHHARARSF